MSIVYKVVPKYFHGLVTSVQIKTDPWGTQSLTLSSCHIHMTFIVKSDFVLICYTYKRITHA